jgi:uncharacterized protein (TIGR02265 family)
MSTLRNDFLDSQFEVPRFARPVVLEEHVRALPDGATCKGLFFHDIIERLRAGSPNHAMLERDGLASKRYVHFFDYSYADYMRVLHGTAVAVSPGIPVGEGLRRLGRSSYVALLKSQLGRVVFGALGSDMRRVLEMGARAYPMVLNFGKVDVEVLGSDRLRYHFRDLPAFLETYQVGVIEGAMQVCGFEGQVRISIKNLGNAILDVRWWPCVGDSVR